MPVSLRILVLFGLLAFSCKPGPDTIPNMYVCQEYCQDLGRFEYEMKILKGDDAFTQFQVQNLGGLNETLSFTRNEFDLEVPLQEMYIGNDTFEVSGNGTWLQPGILFHYSLQNSAGQDSCHCICF